jgi:hypothetical protein
MNETLEQTPSAAELLPHGVWTPWAHVLCWSCHGPKLLRQTLSDEEYAKRCEPRERGEYEGHATCRECGCTVWTRDDVAMLDRLIRSLDDDEPIRGWLQQTGGMCSAATFCRQSTDTDDPGSTDPVIVASDGEDPDQPDAVLLGLYEAADWLHGDGESYRHLGVFTLDKALRVIRHTLLSTDLGVPYAKITRNPDTALRKPSASTGWGHVCPTCDVWIPADRREDDPEAFDTAAYAAHHYAEHADEPPGGWKHSVAWARPRPRPAPAPTPVPEPEPEPVPGGRQIVWFFDKPTVLVCPHCEEVAPYYDVQTCRTCGGPYVEFTATHEAMASAETERTGGDDADV